MRVVEVTRKSRLQQNVKMLRIDLGIPGRVIDIAVVVLQGVIAMNPLLFITTNIPQEVRVVLVFQFVKDVYWNVQLVNTYHLRIPHNATNVRKVDMDREQA